MSSSGKFKCSIEEYNAFPAVRNSLLKLLLDKSPAHYLHAIEHPKEPTDAQIFGSAVHEALLEPKLFVEKMIVIPVFEGKTKDGRITTNANAIEVKEKAAKWHMENEGKTKLTAEQHENIKNMLASVSGHKRAAQLVSDGHAEESLMWTDSEYGIKCKARPDFIREGHILVDLKTTDNASYHSFQKDIANYGYHFQAAMYLEGASIALDQDFDTFIIIAVEKEPPFAVQCFQLDETAIREGKEMFYSALKILKGCMDSGKYPAYGDELTPVSLPSWAIRGER